MDESTKSKEIELVIEKFLTKKNISPDGPTENSTKYLKNK